MVYVVFIVLIFLLSPLFQFASTHPLVSLDRPGSLQPCGNVLSRMTFQEHKQTQGANQTSSLGLQSSSVQGANVLSPEGVSSYKKSGKSQRLCRPRLQE